MVLQLEAQTDEGVEHRYHPRIEGIGPGASLARALPLVEVLDLSTLHENLVTPLTADVALWASIVARSPLQVR